MHPLSLYVIGLYSPYLDIKKLSTIYKMFIAVAITGITAAALFFFVPRFLIGRTVLITHLTFSFFVFYLWRLRVINTKSNKKKKKVLGIIGRKDIVESFLKSTRKDPFEDYTFKILYLSESKNKAIKIPDNRKIKIFEDIREIMVDDELEAIAIDSGEFIENEIIETIYNYRFKFNRPIYNITSLYESLTGRVPINNINKRWFLSNPLFQENPRQIVLKLKRIMDLVLAIILLIISSPIILTAIILIRIDSKGPVLYIQERLGLNRKPFKCYKFRTMIHNAEERSGPVSSIKNDPRLTRLGHFLRRSRIDELPQLFNIIKGDLSFVGPRPIRKHFSDGFSKEIPFYDLRYNVKPGLTGWAQVHGCYAVPNGIKALQYELFYIQHISLILDLHIIFKTLRTVLLGKGK